MEDQGRRVQARATDRPLTSKPSQAFVKQLPNLATERKRAIKFGNVAQMQMPQRLQKEPDVYF